MHRTALLLFLVCSLCSRIAAVCGSQFEVTPPQGAPIIFKQLRFSSDTHGSFGILTVRNSVNRPLTKIMMAVETLSADGSHLVTLQFYAKLRDLEERSPNLLDSIRDVWEHSLQESKEALIHGSTSFAVANCPAAVRIAALEVTFGDGNGYEYALPGWQLEPRLLSVRRISFDNCPKKVPFEVLAHVTIAEDGRAVARLQNEGDTRLLVWLNQQIQTWEFDPARSGGQPLSSTFPMRF